MVTYLFIDESGDPGDIAVNGSNSKHYAELALQVSSSELIRFCEHMTNWRYVKGVFREFKELPGGKDLHRFLSPIIELHQEGIIKCSCVYLDKRTYTGPYLKTTSQRKANPLRFRNFVHRKLLEFHFSLYPLDTSNMEIIFDRFEMSKDALDNLEDYLRNNWNLPEFKYITHADSVYCETLQLTGQLVNAIKDLKLGGADPRLEQMLKFLPIKDITRY